MSKTGSHGERVKASIINIALQLWRDNPAAVTARNIGDHMGLTHSAVLYHFKSVAAIKDAAAVKAVEIGDRYIVPQLITTRHPAAASLSDTVRRDYLRAC